MTMELRNRVERQHLQKMICTETHNCCVSLIIKEGSRCGARSFFIWSRLPTPAEQSFPRGARVPSKRRRNCPYAAHRILFVFSSLYSSLSTKATEQESRELRRSSAEVFSSGQPLPTPAEQSFPRGARVPSKRRPTTPTLLIVFDSSLIKPMFVSEYESHRAEKSRAAQKQRRKFFIWSSLSQLRLSNLFLEERGYRASGVATAPTLLIVFDSSLIKPTFASGPWMQVRDKEGGRSSYH